MTETTKPKPEKTVPALVLTLGGAPDSPHWVPGVPGLYRPDVPTVIGGPGEVSLSYARELDADPGVPLKLVEVPAGQAPELRERAQADHRAHRGGVLAARKTAKGLEVAHVRDAIEHTTTKAA